MQIFFNFNPWWSPSYNFGQVKQAKENCYFDCRRIDLFADCRFYKFGQSSVGGLSFCGLSDNISKQGKNLSQIYFKKQFYTMTISN